MIWTNECTESNEFKVRNPQEVREVLELMGFNVYERENGLFFNTNGEGTFFDEETEVVLSIKPISIEGKEKNLIGIISNYTNSVELNNLEEKYGVTQDEIMVTPLVEYLQEQLLEEQYVTITCASFESKSSTFGDATLSNPFGAVMVITKHNMKFISLAEETDKIVKEYLAK